MKDPDPGETFEKFMRWAESRRNNPK